MRNIRQILKAIIENKGRPLGKFISEEEADLLYREASGASPEMIALCEEF